MEAFAHQRAGVQFGPKKLSPTLFCPSLKLLFISGESVQPVFQLHVSHVLQLLLIHASPPPPPPPPPPPCSCSAGSPSPPVSSPSFYTRPPFHLISSTLLPSPPLLSSLIPSPPPLSSSPLCFTHLLGIPLMLFSSPLLLLSGLLSFPDPSPQPSLFSSHLILSFLLLSPLLLPPLLPSIPFTSPLISTNSHPSSPLTLSPPLHTPPSAHSLYSPPFSNLLSSAFFSHLTHLFPLLPSPSSLPLPSPLLLKCPLIPSPLSLAFPSPLLPSPPISSPSLSILSPSPLTPPNPKISEKKKWRLSCLKRSRCSAAEQTGKQSVRMLKVSRGVERIFALTGQQKSVRPRSAIDRLYCIISASRPFLPPSEVNSHR